MLYTTHDVTQLRSLTDRNLFVWSRASECFPKTKFKKEYDLIFESFPPLAQPLNTDKTHENLLI